MDMLILLFTGFTIGISGAMIPGPLTFFTISEVIKSNRFAGLKIIAGHMALELIFIAAILLKLHRFLDYERFLSFVTLTGGAALILMGALLLIFSPKLKVNDRQSEKPFGKGLFLGGVFFSALSPGFLIWWATIGISTIIRSLLFGVIGVVVLTLGHWAADVGWYWSLSYAVDKGRRLLNDRVYRNIIKVSSVFLIILGVKFLMGV